MKRKQVTVIVFTLALAFFSAALPLSIVKGTVVSGNWLTILWTAFGVSLAIGLMSLDAVWNRIKSVRTRVPYEISAETGSASAARTAYGGSPARGPTDKALEESAPTSSAQELVIAPETTRPAHRGRGPFGEDSYFPQVLVTNGGTEPAEGVRVEIVSWKHRTGDGLFKDSPDFDHPRPLRWEGTKEVTPRRLDPGETARLDLAFTQQQEKEPTHELVLFSFAREGKAGLVDALLGEGHWQAFPPGTYRATVRATAENADPEVVLEIQFDAWDRVAVFGADHYVG
ncbi:MAG: hypothetical protein WKF33_10220 [Thermoleophilaceae bacterium]